MGHLLLRRSWLLPSAPSCQVFIDMGDISVPSVLQTEQLQLPQPFLMGSPVPSSSGPLARSVLVCPRLLYWAPSIYPTVSPQCRGEGSDLLEMLCLWHPGGQWLRCQRLRLWLVVSLVPARFPGSRGRAGLLPAGAASPKVPRLGGCWVSGLDQSWHTLGEGAEPCVLLP